MLRVLFLLALAPSAVAQLGRSASVTRIYVVFFLLVGIFNTTQWTTKVVVHLVFSNYLYYSIDGY